MTTEKKEKTAHTFEKEVSKGGAFERMESKYRDTITADGSSGFKAEAGRYHIYLSQACPWCSRVEIALRLKGLEHVISSSYVYHVMGKIDHEGNSGWVFNEEAVDPLHGAKNLFEVYLKANPDHNSRNTVPLLWDKKTNKIVNNESSDILKFLNTEFQALAKHPNVNYRPERLLKDVEKWNEAIYDSLNNGVYKSGFARSQEAYDDAVKKVFGTLDKLEEHLSKSRYLAGDQLTEADIRLWVTLVRFDAVYNIHFKCSLKRISDYPNLSNYTRELYQIDAFKSITDMKRIREHYYKSHRHINPAGIVAYTDVDFTKPHNRAELLPIKSAGQA